MDITDIVAPPECKREFGSPSDWSLVEGIIEMKLPKDFKWLINCYGTGCFSKFIYPLSPFAPFKTSLNMLSGETKQLLSAYAAGQKEFPQYAPPFPVYPKESGLFPWAITINGDTLFWLREGACEHWTVVICDSKFSEEYDHIKLNSTGFLCRWILGEITPNVFPQGEPLPERVFVPYSASIAS